MKGMTQSYNVYDSVSFKSVKTVQQKLLDSDNKYTLQDEDDDALEAHAEDTKQAEQHMSVEHQAEEQQQPEEGVPQLEQPAEYQGFQCDYTINFIEGANYQQIEIGEQELTYPEALEICVKHAEENSAYGFFYQMQPGGHQIVGLFATQEDMQGEKVLHGHPKGLVATRMAQEE